VQHSSLARLPELLCISLNRFYRVWDPRSGDAEIVKNTAAVSWDFDHISLDAFVLMSGVQSQSQSVVDGVTTTSSSSTTTTIPPPYEAFAVIVHRGQNTASGHYYAYVRDPHDCHSQAWFQANDARVMYHGVPRAESREKERILLDNTDTPYIVYLRRKQQRR